MMAAKRKSDNPRIGFKRLKAKLAQRPDVRSPGGLAAWIGRQKYGPAKFQRAAARGQKLGPNPAKLYDVTGKPLNRRLAKRSVGALNPNLLIHHLPQALFKGSRKKAIQLAQLDADRSRRPVAIVDEKAGRVLSFIRPHKPKRGGSRNPCATPGRYRIRRQGGRRIVEVYRA